MLNIILLLFLVLIFPFIMILYINAIREDFGKKPFINIKVNLIKYFSNCSR